MGTSWRWYYFMYSTTLFDTYNEGTKSKQILNPPFCGSGYLKPRPLSIAKSFSTIYVRTSKY